MKGARVLLSLLALSPDPVAISTDSVIIEITMGLKTASRAGLRGPQDGPGLGIRSVQCPKNEGLSTGVTDPRMCLTKITNKTPARPHGLALDPREKRVRDRFRIPILPVRQHPLERATSRRKLEDHALALLHRFSEREPTTRAGLSGGRDWLRGGYGDHGLSFPGWSASSPYILTICHIRLIVNGEE